MSILEKRASDVRVQEYNMSQVLTSRSSSVSSFVVVSNKGSTKPKNFTSGNAWLAEYGNPNAQISFETYCALNYFSEGNDAWALRVVGAGATTAGVILYLDGGVTKLAPVTAGVVDPENPDWEALLPAGAEEVLALFYPNSGPGSYAHDIALSITSSNVLAPANLAVTSSDAGGVLVPATYEYQVAGLGADGFESLIGAPVSIIIATGGTVTNSVSLTWTQDPNAIGYRIYGRVQGASFGFLTDVGRASNSFRDTGALVADADRKPITDPANLTNTSPTFTLNVFDLSINRSQPQEPFICSLEPYTDGDGVDTELEQSINPFSQYIAVTSNVSSLITVPNVNTSPRTAMAGGDSGAAPTNFQVAAAWEVFRNRQLYPINMLVNGGRADPNVQRTMDAIAVFRADSVALLDVPSSKQDYQAAQDYRNLELNLSSSYSALFALDTLQADNINGKQLYVPGSGWAAALCARTDRVANPSFSIAGLNRGILNVLKTRHTYDDPQASQLFRAQINYPRTFTGIGDALWEQQTLDAKTSALSWLSVRRIVNVMKTSCYDFLLYGLQEPNDEFTTRSLVSACNEYLETVKIARGISRYEVYSDSRNNPVAYINSGIRRITIVVIPILPIHEIRLDMVISKEGVDFAETLNNLS